MHKEFIIRRYDTSFSENVGIPNILRSDLAPVITGKHTDFQDQVKRLRIDLTHSELEWSNQNHVEEDEIGHLKNSFWQKIVSNKVPRSIWDYGLFHQAGILISIARGKTVRAGIDEVTVQTTNILEWLDFDFYDRVWWINKKHPSTTDDKIILGRWLAILHKIWSNLCYWVLMVSKCFLSGLQ